MGGRARRPHLDGLRAVAVGLVLLYHSALTQARGGYVGVDVFFVLSGYLVTEVLAGDIAGSGRIGFARFYARRFLRLLPAAAATLLVVGVAYSMIASPRELSAVVSGFQAAFLYSMNWYVIHQSAQHGSVIVLLNPALLFWSLAVEEQFYFVWPLLLAGLFAVTRRNLPIIRAVIAGGAVLSLTWALTASTSSRPYYRTDARAYELLVGALLALTPGVVRRCSRFADAASATGVVAFGALLFVASSTWHLGTMQRASVATAISFVIIVALEAAPEGIPARVLSLGPVVYLGLISYGIYLWQWPVILILSRYAHPNPWQMAAVAGLITTGLASLSYQILERPVRAVRLFDRAPRAVIATGLATTVVCALVLIPVILRPRTHSTGPSTPTTVVPAGGSSPGAAGLPGPGVRL